MHVQGLGHLLLLDGPLQAVIWPCFVFWYAAPSCMSFSIRFEIISEIQCSCAASRTNNSWQWDCPEIILKAKPWQMKSQILHTALTRKPSTTDTVQASTRNIYPYAEPSETQGKCEKLLSTGVPSLLKRNAVRFAFRTRFLDDISRKVAFTQFCT